MSWPIYTSVTNVGLESCTRSSKNTFVKRSRITKWMIKAFGLTTVALGISSHTNGLSTTGYNNGRINTTMHVEHASLTEQYTLIRLY
jgi:hypothetical protein